MSTERPILPKPPAAVRRGNGAPTAAALARDAFGREIDDRRDAGVEDPGFDDGADRKPRETATDALGRRAGALSDELDFAEFVASLVHGTFDAIVDSSIRQMESFADLVSAVAKPLDQFTQENVTLNQARDYLVEQHPGDLVFTRDGETMRVVARPKASDDDDERSPEWLKDYDLEGEELSAELIEEQLVPLAREKVARGRLQTLATMVLLGMNRVVVRDGTIGARLRFRAAAADHTRVDYAVSDDGGQPPATEWGRRGNRTYSAPTTKVSTVGVNVQSDTELKAELFGEVKINFASETLPLDRFVDDARRTVLERNARPVRGRVIEAPRVAGDGAAAAQPPAAAPAAPVTPVTPAPPPAGVTR